MQLAVRIINLIAIIITLIGLCKIHKRANEQVMQTCLPNSILKILSPEYFFEISSSCIFRIVPCTTVCHVLWLAVHKAVRVQL